ncbi:MAG: ribosomal protein S18-alanine N-acetyltransferase [Halopseudomonas sp.]
MAELLIRPMVEADLESVAQVEYRLFSSPTSLKQFRQSLDAGHCMWLAQRQDCICGYLVASHGGGVADLLTIGVDLQQRRMGVARRLLSGLFEQLQRLSVDELFLEVRQSNSAAIGLYLRCGFESVGLRKGYYPGGAGREDAVVMRMSQFAVE